jgi:hypothetical protein
MNDEDEYRAYGPHGLKHCPRSCIAAPSNRTTPNGRRPTRNGLIGRARIHPKNVQANLAGVSLDFLVVGSHYSHDGNVTCRDVKGSKNVRKQRAQRSIVNT